MLPPSHRQKYQEFSTALESLQNSIGCLEEQDKISIEKFQQLQRIFQLQIMPLGFEGLDPSITFKWQSTQTEIYRTWKLLEVEMMFLKSCRQASTKTKRVEQIRNRLQQLMNYCQALLTND